MVGFGRDLSARLAVVLRYLVPISVDCLGGTLVSPVLFVGVDIMNEHCHLFYLYYHCSVPEMSFFAFNHDRASVTFVAWCRF